MNFRLTALLAVIAAALIGWSWSLNQGDDDALAGLIKKEGEADYSGQQMTTGVYNLQGQLQYVAEAAEVKRYESSGRTEFLKPFLQLFDQADRLNQWKVSADSAEISNEKILTLSGNVRIEAVEPDSRLQQIETDRLQVDLTTQDIFTESQVKMRGLGFTNTGTGLTGNLKQQTASLTRDVKTYIEPTVIRDADQKNKDKQ